MLTEMRVVDLGSPVAYPEVQGKTIHNCELSRGAVLQAGMESGRASVAFLIDLPDGSVAFVQTSARNFEMIAAIVRGACQKWGEDNT